ncbi:hypothetical protein M0R45_030092 [Rubus argutus]|uniref:Uncharacterized protein n=1 Tax=Rubus argutus TaxID=59490 RepID=A0AAW1WBZ5_RUBAR
MKGLFIKPKPRTPADVVRQTHDLLIYADSCESKRRKDGRAIQNIGNFYPRIMTGSLRSKLKAARILQVHYQTTSCEAVGRYFAAFVKFSCNDSICELKENLRILMNLLIESSKSIQIEALHLFADFKIDREDEQFEADKALVVREIAALEPKLELS